MFDAKCGRYADIIASIEGLVWLGLAWSISISVHTGNTEPTLAALFIVGALVLFSWAHRPMRYLLCRYHIRKRRTDMWIHILALPLLLAMFFQIHGGSDVRQHLAATKNAVIQSNGIRWLADLCHDATH